MSSGGERERATKAPKGTGGAAVSGEESSVQLPLRLSVARGGLGVELTESQALGPVILEELELSLVGVRYPVDLSRGVKQFHNRRGRLERAVLRVDFDELGRLLGDDAADLLGEPLVELRLGPRGFGQSKAEEGEVVTPSVAVTLLGESRALAFDWVLCSGLEPEWVIDGARGVGLEPGRSALELALSFVDRVAARFASAELTRSGRAVRLRDLSKLVSLWVLPSFGFRVPEVGEQVVERVELRSGALIVAVDSSAEPLGVGRRGLRLAGLAELTRAADGFLGRAARGDARRAYLEALEGSPRSVEISSALAALDLAEPGRAEAALSVLDERSRADEPWPSRQLGLEADALEQSGRRDEAAALRVAAAKREPDPLLAALSYCRLGGDDAERAVWLERALERSPGFRLARLARFCLRVRRGELRQALGDAEHLDALTEEPAARAEQAAEFGSLLLAGGFRVEAIHWFKRALRALPDFDRVKLELARALSSGGEPLRAIELLQTTSSTLDGELEVRRNFQLAELMAQEKIEPSQSIALLRGVDSRSEFGVRARLLEGRLALDIGDQATRVRAHSRLIEVLEVGWLEPGRELPALLAVAERELEQRGSELARRALALARAALTSGQAVDSGENERKQLEERLNSLERRLAES